MTDNHPMEGEPVKIAVNVMRARLTVIGFNIAVVAYQMSRLQLQPGGIKLPNLEFAIHAGSQVALLLAVAVSVAAIVAYLFSSQYDQVGTCTSSSIVAGDILMYLGLACTISGFFSPLENTLEILTHNVSSQAYQFHSLHTALLIAGAISWFLAAYVGPLRALRISPFSKNTNSRLFIFYILLFACISWVLANGAAIDAHSASGVTFNTWLLEFIQPIRW